LDADFSFKETGEMSLARILVSLNIRGGLRKELNITDRGFTRAQILDYEGIPFHCRRCHAHGHILKDFPQPMHGLPSSSRLQEADLHQQGLNPSPSASPSTSSSHSHRSLDRNSPGVQQTSTTSTAGSTVRPDQQDFRWTTLQAQDPAPPLPSGTLLPPPPPLNSLINLHFTIPLPVRDPLRAFKYLKLDCPLTLGSHPHPLSLIESPPPPPSSPTLNPLFSPPPPDPLPSSSPEETSSDATEEPTILFQLRNRTILIPPTKNSGLGLDPVDHSKKGRGRTSLLSKAQSKARIDIASGHQQSIFGALREVHTPGRVTP
jgi:hypothetical protein